MPRKKAATAAKKKTTKRAKLTLGEKLIQAAKEAVAIARSDLPSATDIYILLDRSGSMASQWTTTINAINGYVRECAVAPTHIGVTLVTFDSAPQWGVRSVGENLAFEISRRCYDAKTWHPVTPAEITPRGGTPLFDAIGRLVGMVEADRLTKPETLRRSVIAIMTDGEENASRIVSRQMAKDMLDKLRRQDVQVIFLGADFDAMPQASSLGSSLRQTVSYTPQSAGMAMNMMASNTVAYATGNAATMDWSDAQRTTLAANDYLAALKRKAA